MVQRRRCVKQQVPCLQRSPWVGLSTNKQKHKQYNWEVAWAITVTCHYNNTVTHNTSIPLHHSFIPSIENTSAAKLESPVSSEFNSMSPNSEVFPWAGGLGSMEGLTTVASTPLALPFSASLANCIPLSMELLRLMFELVSSCSLLMLGLLAILFMLALPLSWGLALACLFRLLDTGLLVSPFVLAGGRTGLQEVLVASNSGARRESEPLPVFTDASSSLLDVRVDSRLLCSMPRSKLWDVESRLGLSLYSSSE